MLRGRSNDQAKKELLRQIGQMERSVQMDIHQGFGFAPANAFDKVYEEMYKLQEELAHLRHYASAEEMLCDTRVQAPNMGIVFQTVSSIKVVDKDWLSIRFKDGTELDQAVERIERRASA